MEKQIEINRERLTDKELLKKAMESSEVLENFKRDIEKFIEEEVSNLRKLANEMEETGNEVWEDLQERLKEEGYEEERKR